MALGNRNTIQANSVSDHLFSAMAIDVERLSIGQERVPEYCSDWEERS